jgi:hypothetical protein
MNNKETISVFGLWRDSESHINTTLSSLDDLILDNKHNYEFYFYENDSKDNTRSILSDWLKNKNGKLLYEDIGAPKFGSVSSVERLLLLSYYRNKLNTLSKNLTSELSLLIDTDIMFDNNNIYTLHDSYRAINDKTCCMVSANTRQYQIPDLMYNTTQDSFYDVFALRDKFGNNCVYFTDCPLVLNEDRELWLSNKPVKVMSAFSGMSFIKTNVLKQCFWSTNSNSEHVNFCYEVNRHGSIYIIPECRPKTKVDLSSISLDACKNIAKSQADFIQKINQVYQLSKLTSLEGYIR